MQAIILAGGFGTRLKSLGHGVPKPMAPIAGTPFLAWLLEHMESQGITDATLCLHHQHERISSYFGPRFGGIRLHYLIEEKPLGTGGAFKQALQGLDRQEPVLALNGDSLVLFDYQKMFAHHAQANRPITLAARHVSDCRRYSKLTLKGESIERFELLGNEKPGLVSVGCYIFSPNLFDSVTLPEQFSLERDFLSLNVPTLKPAAYRQVDYFIDIGTPEDYSRAQVEIPSLFARAAA